MPQPSYGARRSSGVRAVTRPRVVAPVVIIAAIAVAVPFTMSAAKPTAKFDGLSDGAVLNKAKADTLAVHLGGVSASKVRATLDGQPVQFTQSGTDLLFHPSGLTDGKHTLDVKVNGALGDSHIVRAFTVDETPPQLAFTPPQRLPMGQPLTLQGTVDGGSSLTANGQAVNVTGANWSVTFPKAPSAVQLVATDQAGNRTAKQVTVAFQLPQIHAVHMTALAWSYKPKHDATMALLRAHKINAVELDIKDEDGNVGYKSAVPLASKDGATAEAPYDAKKAVAEIHAAGGVAIGRLVAFKDPNLCKWAWATGHHDMVIQDAQRGGPLSPGHYGSCSFTSFANPQVDKYNVDIAVEAAKIGFDHILFDYVRRPDGNFAKMRIPGIKGSGEAQVAAFVGETRKALNDAGVDTYLGASVFGISATRPKEIAQNITMISKYVDYVAPMVYPSHWAQGEYNVADPNSMPYQIVQRSLKDFQAKVKGSNAVVVPWLQDFSLGVHYDTPQVVAQTKAAHDDGIDSFLLWNASCNYHPGALPVLK